MTNVQVDRSADGAFLLLSDVGSMAIRSVRRGVVLVTIVGRDGGQYGDQPFTELRERLSAQQSAALYVHGRETTAPSMDVSADWARFFMQNSERLRHVSMLVGSPFVRMTADFVRKFAGFEDKMRIYTSAAAFEEALAAEPADPNAR